MRKLLELIVVVMVVCVSVAQAEIVSPRDISELTDNDPNIWYAYSGYTNGQWRDRYDWGGNAPGFPDAFMAQSGYGEQVRTVLSGLVPGNAYDVWIYFSSRLNASGDTLKDDGISAAFDAGTGTELTLFDQTNSTNTGMISRNETTTIYTIFKGYLGSAIADVDGDINVLVGYGVGTLVNTGDRSIYHALEYSIKQLINNSPVNNATKIPVDTSDADNDLVFTIFESNIVEVDIQLGFEDDPNLTIDPFSLGYKIVNGMEVDASGGPAQYTINLESGLSSGLLTDGHLKYETDYYWKVIGYEPNAVTSLLEPVDGPVWKFTTEAIAPSISGVSPVIASVKPDVLEDVVFTVTGDNVETYTWYKTGSGTPLVSDDVNYTITTEGDLLGSTLTVLDILADDVGTYYCVGTKAGFDPVTSDPVGEVVLKELRHYFPFNAGDVVDGKTLDTQGGIWGQLMNGAAVVPYSEPNSIVGDYLHLNNPDTSSTDAASAQYVDILSQAVFNYSDITVSTWFKLSSTGTFQPIWGTGMDDTNFIILTPTYNLNQYYKQGNWNFGHDMAMGDTKLDGNGRDIIGVYDVVPGQWYHMAITIASDGDSKLYINGKFVSNESMFNLLDMPNNNNFIGRAIYGLPNSNTFNGFVDELKIYNYVLTNDEVAQEYMDVSGDSYVCDAENYDIGLKDVAKPNTVYDTGDLDLDNDCQVGLGDFALIAARWLEDDRIYYRNP